MSVSYHIPEVSKYMISTDGLHASLGSHYDNGRITSGLQLSTTIYATMDPVVDVSDTHKFKKSSKELPNLRRRQNILVRR